MGKSTKISFNQRSLNEQRSIGVFGFYAKYSDKNVYLLVISELY